MLKRITFSGIDPSVSPEALKALHAEFPIIEFAFLFTESRKADPRHPMPMMLKRCVKAGLIG